MLFDSEFLIGASGQRGRRPRERAESFLRSHPDAPLYTSRVCWAEFAEGCDTREQASLGLARFAIVEIDEPIAWQASRIGRALSGVGLPIGDNDIWIAATAIAYELPLVSNNVRHFSRVRELDLRTY
jgi:predicted nucleic acid-binding protein